MPIKVHVPEQGIAGISNCLQTEPIVQDLPMVAVISKLKSPPLAVPDQVPTIASAMVGEITVVETGAVVGRMEVDAIGVAAGAQAENNTLTSINTEISNLRVFIFSPV